MSTTPNSVKFNFITKHIDDWKAAASKGDVEKLKHYVNAGLDIDIMKAADCLPQYKAHYRVTALEMSVWNNQLKATEFLLSSGAKLNRNKCFFTTCEFGYIEIARVLASQEGFNLKEMALARADAHDDESSQAQRLSNWRLEYCCFKEAIGNLQLEMIDYLLSIGGRISLLEFEGLKSETKELGHMQEFEEMYDATYSLLVSALDKDRLEDEIKDISRQEGKAQSIKI